MSDRSQNQQIRFSYGINIPDAVIPGVGVMLVISCLVLLDDLIITGGAVTPLVLLISAVIIGVNLLGYLELTQSVSRVGGAYQIVHSAEEGNWLAFLTGWITLLAGASAAGLIIHSFSQQLTILLDYLFNIAIPHFPVAAAILILTAAAKLLPVNQRRKSTFLIFLLLVVLAVSLGAIPQMQGKPVDLAAGDWKGTFQLVLVVFIGLEITSGLAGDINNRSKNLTRVLLSSLVLAGLIPALLALIAYGGLPSETPSNWNNILIDLAGTWSVTWVRNILSVLSLIALPLALDRVLSFLTKQFFSMTRDGYWPTAFKRVNQRTKRPLLILTVISGLILLTQAVDKVYLAGLGGLLYLLVLIAVNITLARQEQTTSTFTLPIHPWIPALVVVLDLLIALIWIKHLPTAGILIGVGLLLFVTYGRHHSIKAKEGITVFKSEIDDLPAKQNKRILVPIANPDTAESLLRLAGTLAKPENGKVIALRVITVPNQLPLSEGRIEAEANRVLLDQAIDQATKEEFRIQTMTRVSRSIAEGIIDTAREEDVDQILVGWSGGQTRSINRSMGPVLDPIINNAPCDVLIVKGFDWLDIKTILVPAAGGPNAPIGARLAASISQSTGAKVTGLYVQTGRASSSRMAENRRILDELFQDLDFDHEPEKKIVNANSPLSGILREAENYDLVIVGASEQGSFDQFAFGSIPQRIASQSANCSIMIKGYTGASEFFFRKILKGIFNLFPTLTIEEQLEVREDLIDDAQPGQDYFILIVLSSIIATLGLLLNSPAVVIGAMLVAPLMSPILGLSLGIVLGEIKLVRTSLESMFKGIMATIIVAVIVGLISPIKDMTPEILSRTQPTLLDLFIALASGMAGAYAMSRKDVSAALPGVAIAAALAPPLAVVGLGLAHGDMGAASGALLLFVTNLITISLAGVIIFSLLGIHPISLQPDVQKRVRRGVMGMVILVVALTVPLGLIMGRIIRHSRQDQIIREVLVEHSLVGGISDLEIDRSMERELIHISASIRSSEPLTQKDVDQLDQMLEEELAISVVLDLINYPSLRSD